MTLWNQPLTQTQVHFVNYGILFLHIRKIFFGTSFSHPRPTRSSLHQRRMCCKISRSSLGLLPQEHLWQHRTHSGDLLHYAINVWIFRQQFPFIRSTAIFTTPSTHWTLVIMPSKFLSPQCHHCCDNLKKYILLKWKRNRNFVAIGSSSKCGGSGN